MIWMQNLNISLHLLFFFSFPTEKRQFFLSFLCSLSLSGFFFSCSCTTEIRQHNIYLVPNAIAQKYCILFEDATQIQLLIFISLCIIKLLEMPNFKWLNIHIFNMLKVRWVSIIMQTEYLAHFSQKNRLKIQWWRDAANNCYNTILFGWLLFFSLLCFFVFAHSFHLAKMTESQIKWISCDCLFTELSFRNWIRRSNIGPYSDR